MNIRNNAIRLSLICVFVFIGIMIPRMKSQAATPAGTLIMSTVNATYSDSSGSGNYTTNSNTVITVVQNAPSLTNAAAAGATTVPGGSFTDTFTLTNTGNNSAGGYFQLDGAPTLSLAGASITGYTLTYNGTGPTAYGTLAALNSALTSDSIGASGATNNVIVGVIYSVPTSATAGSPTDTLLANVTYPAGGTAPNTWSVETSADASAVATDTISNEARLDLQLAGANPAGVINYTLTLNNGGGTGTADLTSAKTLLGAASKGVFVSEKVPLFGASPLAFSTTVSIASNAANGYNAANYQVYYTTNAAGTAGWTTAAAANTAGTPGAGARYIGVYFYGGAGGVEFNADAAGSTTTTVTNAAATITFGLVQPTGTGAGDPNSVPNIMNAMWGDNQPTEHVLGPGVPSLTADSTTTTTITNAGQGINNTVAPPASGYSGGYSNTTSNQALTSYSLANGPCTSATVCTAASVAATGSYNGVVAATTSNDFTAMSFTQTGGGFIAKNSSTTLGSPTGSNTTATVGSINLANGVQNTGNASTNVTLVATAPTSPAGWTVGIYTNAAGAPGALLGGATVGATSTAVVAVASNAILEYWTVYTAPNATPSIARYDANIVASVNAGATTDTTHNELYSGYVALTLTPTIVSNGCPAGVTPGPTGVCPGGVMSYALDYRNIVVGCGAGTGTPSGTEPTYACSAVTPTAGTLVITNDGSGAFAATPTNNWSTYSNGLNAPPTESAATGNGASTFTYTPGPGAAAATKFAATIGGAAGNLKPGASGTLTYSITIK